MAISSYLQTSFLGGKWSNYAQGRAELETYRTGLNECLNMYPVPVGANVRRQGTLFGATTRDGVFGVVRTFEFSQNQPFSMEFTAGHLRLWNGLSLVLTSQHAVGSISTATPAVVNTPVAHGFSTGDQVEFQPTLLLPGNSPSGIKPLFNRQFSITVVDANNFSLQDPVTGANIDGSTINTAGWSIQVGKILDYAVPYLLADLENIRVVQSEDTALILCPGYAPYQIANLNSLSGLGVNEIAPPELLTLLDGPYLDPPTDGTTLTPSGLSGSITLTASAITSVNNGLGFLSTDVGRLVRMFAQPAQWASGATYSKGQNVTYNSAYYQSIVGSNVGNEPDTDPGTHWAVATTAAGWTWAIITAITSTSEVTATVQAADPLGVQAGGPLLNDLAQTIWQLGAWSNSTTWPTGGTFHEGRFWLFSDIKNRADATMSNNYGIPATTGLTFAPTTLDGTVADNNGIPTVLEGTDTNSIFWAVSTETGIVFGTQAGEWNVVASAYDDPITPTSIQAKRKTRYGCANVEPVVAPLATLFVQRYNRHLYEYISDVYSRKWTGTNLSEKAQDIILPGIAEIALVNVPVPILWARTTDNRLIGMSYKRESPFGTQPASFYGWHHHALGSGRQVVSMRAGPSAVGNTDNITMVTLDPATGIYFVEFMAPYFDENSGLLDADFLDAAVTPSSAVVSGNNVIFYGLNYLVGKTITAWVGGVDGGDYTVAVDGSLTVPINVAGGLLTSAYLASLTGGSFALNIQVTPPGKGFFSPVGAAIDYTQARNASAHNSQMPYTACFDWDAGLFYYEDGNEYWHAFNIANQTEEWVTNAIGELGVAGATCLGYDGNIYFGTSDSAHLVGRFNVTTQTTDLNYDDSHSLPAVGYVVGIELGDTQYVLATGLDSGQGSPGQSAPWFIVNMTDAGGPAWTGASGFFDETITSLSPGNAFPCRGPAAKAFVVVENSLTAATVIGVYQATVESPTAAGMGKIGVVTPSQVVSTWTGFHVPVSPGVIYDETDGNLIVLLEGSDSTFRLVKISTASAAVLWAVTVTSSVDFHTARVRGGRMSFLMGSSPYTLAEIDTIAGTIDTSIHTTAIGPGPFSTDDKFGQIVVNVNDIGTINWATFGPAVGGGAITPAVVYNSPVLLGFTCPWRFQLLRAINPQETGTQQGPALGKTRRTAEVAVMMSNTQGVQMGTDFTATMRDLDFRLPVGGPTELTKLQLFTGTHFDSIEDDYSFDSMIGFTGSRPYPANFNAVEAFGFHTSERG